MNIRLLLTFFLGIVGAHKFYQGNRKAALIYLFTGGLLLVGWVADSISLGFRGRDFFFNDASTQVQIQPDLRIGPIAKAFSFFPLIIVLIAVSGNDSRNTQDRSSSRLKNASDVAFCAGYYASIVPGASERRHCAGTDVDSGLRCRSYALNGTYDAIARREDMAANLDMLKATYRSGMASGRKWDDPESANRCLSVFNAIADQMQKP
jgi:hypothetical protein